MFSCIYIFKDKINVWTFYKRQSNGVCYSDDHSEEVLCAALSSDGKKAITGQYN